MIRFVATVFFFTAGVPFALAADPDAEALWRAAKTGDIKQVAAALKRGVDVNAKTDYGATALSFASERGHAEVVKLLLRNKADINIRDRFYRATPLTWAAMNKHAGVVELLLKAGAKIGGGLGAAASMGNAKVIGVLLKQPGVKPMAINRAVFSAVLSGEADAVRALLKTGKVKPETLNRALSLTGPEDRAVAAVLKANGAKPIALPKTDPNSLRPYVGHYSRGSWIASVRIERGRLAVFYFNRKAAVLQRKKDDTFHSISDEQAVFKFVKVKDRFAKLDVKQGPATIQFERIESAGKPRPGKIALDGPTQVAKPMNWPSFRGPLASGVADGQFPPVTWNAKSNDNVVWRTRIPGLGHSCPVVWGRRIYITTAVSGDETATLKPGLYGDVDSVKDPTVHTWYVYCLDKKTGKVRWRRQAHRGVPIIKRHLKGTHANPTIATNGKRLVASFGAEGLFCYTTGGQLVWKTDLGIRSAGWFYDSAYEWGVGSSPIIYRGLVIVQCDTGKKSFITALRLSDGKPVWRTPRDEIPSWATPTVFEFKTGAELVTNGTKAVRGYDPMTGKELWRLGPNSEIAVPTPFFGDGLIFIASGYRTPKPIYAVKPGARGNISPGQSKSKSKTALAWHNRGGTYLPTPILHRSHVYACNVNGVLSCYEAKTGRRVYRRRLAGNAFTGSPVAADGRLYFVAENGRTYVVKAGPRFQLLAVNPLDDVCMTTPAISDGMLYVRTERYLFGLGRR